MPADWLAALDDQLCARLTHCTLCGTGSGPVAYVGVWEMAGPPRRHVAYALCTRCNAQPAWREALRALLRQRYHEEKAYDH